MKPRSHSVPAFATLAALALALLGGCATEEDWATGPCSADATLECTSDECVGRSTCQPDGTWGACVCDSSTNTGNASTASTTGTATTGGTVSTTTGTGASTATGGTSTTATSTTSTTGAATGTTTATATGTDGGTGTTGAGGSEP